MSFRKSRTNNSIVFLFMVGLTFMSCASTESTFQTEAARSAETNQGSGNPTVAKAERTWPRKVRTEDANITVYQPEAESWSNNLFKERAAISVETPGAARPIYGEIILEARTVVGEVDRRVDFKDVRIIGVTLPLKPNLAKDARKALQKNAEGLLDPVSLDRLKSGLTISQVEARQKAPALRNVPPKVFVSESPSVLILIDGEPILRETEEEGILRVVNSRNLILTEVSSGRYFLYVANRWMTAQSMKGPWTIAKDTPSSLEEVRQSVVGQNQVDLLSDSDSTLVKEVKKGTVPKVFVSTQPAELLQIRGGPGFKSIPGTKLLYVDNTRDTIIMNEGDQQFYALLSGRWYRAGSLDGAWKFVSAKELPAEFSKIPPNHRKGDVLASVAGTPQARDAAIRNDVPQVARVDRRNTEFKVTYDGDPQFKPIESTTLRYAVNAATPVILVDSNTYYALRAGVWFISRSPQGPWTVATEVPPEIYRIPPSSPLYYVTYVRVYDYNPEFVYVGYTPGYLGSYYTSDGVVVFGTGYNYPPWVGSVWIGFPFTFGLSWGYWGPYSWWGPWWGWGPYYYPYAYYGYYGPYPYPYPGTVPPQATQSNVYQGWSAQSVSVTNPAPFNTPYPAGTQQAVSTPPGIPGWQAIPPGSQTVDSSDWSAPSQFSGDGTVPWGASQQSEAERAKAFTPPAQIPDQPAAPEGGWSAAGEVSPPSSDFSGGGWGPAIPPPAPAAPAAPAPAAPPPAPAAPAAPPAAGQAFPGGGWGPKK